MTAVEFEDLLRQPDHAERFFELIDGEPVEKVPTEAHNLLSGNLYLDLRQFVDPRDLGRVVYETRYRIPTDERNVRQPDLSFTCKARLQPVVEQGAVPQMPDLVIEIKSPDDTYAALRRKAFYYLAHGARLVWLLYPEKRLIEVYRSETDSEILTETDLLDGGDVLPGFSVPVSKIFTL